MRTKFTAKAFLILSAVSLLFAVSAGAADISGKWIAQVTSPSGSPGGDRVFTFKVDGDKLTGTIINQTTVNAAFEVEGQPKLVGKLTTQTGTPSEITEGKVSGNDISFATVSRMGQNEMKTTYKGAVSGNEIKFTAETPMPAGMPMMGAPTASQGASGSSQGAQPTTRTQEMVAKRMN